MLSTWKSHCAGVSQRWVFVFMAFLGLSLGNALRVALSITITEMVTVVDKEEGTLNDTCASHEARPIRNVTYGSGENVYNWDEYTQGIILSSYFWGYAATQFLFGWLSERYGGKYFMGFGILLPSICTFLTPFAIKWGDSTALVIVRVIMGMTSGAMYPSVSTMISCWTTLRERTKMGSIVYAGAIVGTVFGTTMPAIIISNSSWPAVFYIFGAAGIAWFPIWVLLCYNSPSQHPYMSEAEIKYLQENEEKSVKKLPPAPWGHILASKEFWAFVMALVGCDWAYFTVANDLPKYMSSIVKFSLENNGYLSSLPYLCMWFNSLLSSWLINKLIKRGFVSITNVRKLFATVALMGPGIFLLGASYAECDKVMVEVMFILGMTLMGCSYPSLMVNALDLSPNYAGTLMALGNGIAALGGVFTPYIVGVLTPNQTIQEWRLVFWIVFIVSLLTNVYFALFASGEVQEWDNPDFVRNKEQRNAPKNVKKHETNNVTTNGSNITQAANGKEVDLESARV